MVYSLLVNAQNNLVHNPSFEEYTGNCVFIDYNSLTHWYNPDCFGTPEYMHECLDYPNTTSAGVPENIRGYQWAKEGKAYVLISWDNNLSSYDGFREYLAQRLKAPLQAGKEYCVSFYASLSDYAAKFVYGGSNALGLILSKDSIYADSIYYFNSSWWLWSCNNIYGTPVIGDSTKILDDTLNWVKIEGKYIAKGGEEFLAIGNFYPNSQTRFERYDFDGYGSTAYFIDMVELFLCEDTVQKPLEPPPASDSSLHYKLPNVISPNADGLNDAFMLESRGVKEVSVTLYNRWGEEVHRHKISGISTDVLSKTQLWDATHKNKPAPQGVYYYIIELSTKTGEVIIEKGTLTVL
ncbi:MAG: gliding motility-associated C-terminal domain-containing protein [Bacteroidia bacterium]